MSHSCGDRFLSRNTTQAFLSYWFSTSGSSSAHVLHCFVSDCITSGFFSAMTSLPCSESFVYLGTYSPHSTALATAVFYYGVWVHLVLVYLERELISQLSSFHSPCVFKDQRPILLANVLMISCFMFLFSIQKILLILTHSKRDSSAIRNGFFQSLCPSLIP